MIGLGRMMKRVACIAKAPPIINNMKLFIYLNEYVMVNSNNGGDVTSIFKFF